MKSDISGDFADRRLSTADAPVPFITGRYPSRGPLRQAWELVWDTLAGGLTFTVDELMVFVRTRGIELQRQTLARLLRQARKQGHLSSGQRMVNSRPLTTYRR